MALEDRIIKMIAEKLDLERSTIKTHAELINDLGADSMDMEELHLSTEELLEIEHIPDEIWGKIITVQNLINCATAYC